jgi:hypothetical protein
MIRIPASRGMVGEPAQTDPCEKACTDDNRARSRNVGLVAGLIGIVAGAGIAWYAVKHQNDVYDDEGYFRGLSHDPNPSPPCPLVRRC